MSYQFDVCVDDLERRSARVSDYELLVFLISGRLAPRRPAADDFATIHADLATEGWRSR
jgi:hypothetical protein